MALESIRGTKITIGGLGGTGKGSVSWLLADDLGYKLMSAGKYFRDFAIEEKVPNAVIEERAITDERYDRMLDRRTEDYGLSNDHFVFEGRLAWRFIEGVHILLTCKLETRVARIAGREGMSFEQAMFLTKHREEAATKRYMNLYGISDITNTDYYALTVNTTDVTAEQVTAAIIKHLKNIGAYHPLKVA